MHKETNHIHSIRLVIKFREGGPYECHEKGFHTCGLKWISWKYCQSMTPNYTIVSKKCPWNQDPKKHWKEKERVVGFFSVFKLFLVFKFFSPKDFQVFLETVQFFSKNIPTVLQNDGRKVPPISPMGVFIIWWERMGERMAYFVMHDIYFPLLIKIHENYFSWETLQKQMCLVNLIRHSYICFHILTHFL